MRGKNFPPTLYSTLNHSFVCHQLPRNPSKSKRQRIGFPFFSWRASTPTPTKIEASEKWQSIIGFPSGASAFSPSSLGLIQNSNLPSGASRSPLSRGPAVTWRRVRGAAGMGFRQPPSAPGKRQGEKWESKKGIRKQNQMYFFSCLIWVELHAGTCYCQWKTLVKGFSFLSFVFTSSWKREL